MHSGRAHTWLIVLLGLLVVLAVGGYALFRWGTDILEREVEVLLRDNPVIVEHIGRIRSFELDFTASSAEPDENTFIYRIVGEKGEGEVAVESITNDDGAEEIRSGRLRMSSGEAYDLMPEPAPASPP